MLLLEQQHLDAEPHLSTWCFLSLSGMAAPRLVPLHRYLNAAACNKYKIIFTTCGEPASRQTHECSRDTGIDIDIAKEVICGAKSFPPTMLPEPVPALAATAAAFPT